MNRLTLLTAGMLTALCVQPLSAEVVLPDVLTSGMVVQRDKPVRLWGKAEPGERVVARCGKKQKADAVADAAGNWLLELPPLPAGGPYTIRVNDIELGDVLSGDVFFCSGQSNMELPVARVLDMFADEVMAYENPSIRQFLVTQKYDFHAATESASGSWRALDKNSALSFSAICYFFAKKLHAATGVPVGIINSSWGGTPIEAWIDYDHLAEFPMARNKWKVYADDQYRDAVKRVESANFQHWDAALYAGDPGLHGAVKWYAPELDDSSWTEVALPGEYGSSRTSWGTDGINPLNGSHWFRTEIEVPAEAEGKDAVVRLGCVVDADSVYFNGTFIGTTSYQYPPRIYRVPGSLVKAGKNQLTVRLISKNGVPEFVAEKPYKFISGDLTISLEKAWRYHMGAHMPSSPGMEFYYYTPTVLFNAMVRPLTNVQVAGVVWYQGESNVSRRNEYASLLATLMGNWRQAWANPTMPFYIVELAGFLHPSDAWGQRSWQELRDAQAQAAAADPNAWLIKNGDLGEWNDIHPLDKKTVGERLADTVLQNR